MPSVSPNDIQGRDIFWFSTSLGKINRRGYSEVYSHKFVWWKKPALLRLLQTGHWPQKQGWHYRAAPSSMPSSDEAQISYYFSWRAFIMILGCWWKLDLWLRNEFWVGAFHICLKLLLNHPDIFMVWWMYHKVKWHNFFVSILDKNEVLPTSLSWFCWDKLAAWVICWTSPKWYAWILFEVGV